MERTVHKALGLGSCGVTPTPLLAPHGRKSGAERALKLRSRLKEKDATIGDEKDTHVEVGGGKVQLPLAHWPPWR